MSVDISARSSSTERIEPAVDSEFTRPGSSTIASDLVAKPARSPWSIAVRRFRGSKLALFGLLLIALITLGTIFAEVIAPYGENEIDLFNITAQPSEAHVLGTDELGRDELSRLLYGGRISLSVGIGAALISTLLGIIVGAIAGYFGGWLDTVLMRFIDLMLAFPAIFLWQLGPERGAFPRTLLLDVAGSGHPRRVLVAQATRFRRGSTIHRRAEWIDHPSSSPAKCDGGHHRFGDAQHRRCHAFRSVSVVSRVWGSA